MARKSKKNSEQALGRDKPNLVANYSPIGITAVAASARYQGERKNNMSEMRALSSSEEDDGAADPSRARGRRK